MARGSLSDPTIIQLLKPFIVTSWHGGKESEMDADVKEIFTQSELSSDPNRLNVLMFALDSRGNLVHSFYGLPGRGIGRSDYRVEIPKALTKLNLPAVQSPPSAEDHPAALPDLKASASDVPAGVRLFVRLSDESDAFRSRFPVVEVVPMKAEEWKAFAFPQNSKDIAAETLRSWLVQLYPAGIRTADQSKPFRNIAGVLELEPAGADDKFHYALLRGEVRLTKDNAETDSAFEGTLQAVLIYRRDSSDVHSLRGVIEGAYIYRIRGTSRMKMSVAVESRPE